MLRATAARNFRFLIRPHGSAPAALASLLFDHPEPQNIGRTQCFPAWLVFFADRSSLSLFALLWFFPFLTFSPFCLFSPLMLHLSISRKFDFQTSFCTHYWWYLKTRCRIHFSGCPDDESNRWLASILSARLWMDVVLQCYILLWNATALIPSQEVEHLLSIDICWIFFQDLTD